MHYNILEYKFSLKKLIVCPDSNPPTERFHLFDRSIYL